MDPGSAAEGIEADRSDERLAGEGVASQGHGTSADAPVEPMHTVELGDAVAEGLAAGMAAATLGKGEREVSEPHPSNDKASLLNTDVGADGGSGSTLVNWNTRAQQLEALMLALIVFLLSLALNGASWLLGTNTNASSVRVGLKAAFVDEENENVRFQLSNACLKDTEDEVGEVSCALSSAGGVGLALVCTSLALAVVLLIHAVLLELHTHGKLKPLLDKLPPDLPEDKVALALREGPLIAWGLLLLFEYLTLLVYATKVPPSLGAGGVAFGSSYGLVRLSIIVTAAATATHLALVRGIGEVMLTEVLDGLKAATTGTDRTSTTVQALMLLALFFELVLWVREPGWGGLLQLYGLWSFQCKFDMTLYSCASIVAIAVDVLTLVTPLHPDPPVFVYLVMWLLLLDRMVTLSLLRYHRYAFV